MSASEPRIGHIERGTRETRISVTVNVDGSGRSSVTTGIAFLDHMLDAVARHGVFDIEVRADGDLAIDPHHTTEDVGIALGRAFDQALGDRRGIVRMGWAYAPLDEALARVVIDIGGRGYAVIDASIDEPHLGQLDSDLVRHFFESFAIESRMNVHADILRGKNGHHRAEALFKAFARALDAATRRDPRLGDAVPSTKGVIDRTMS